MPVSEIDLAPEEYHPYMSDYGYHDSVQSPNEHPFLPPPGEGDSRPAAEHPHPDPVEYYCAPPPYGMTSDVQVYDFFCCNVKFFVSCIMLHLLKSRL